MQPYPMITYTLKDGQVVTIRPIRPDDGPRIQALVKRLSPQTSYLRFHEYVQTLSDRQVYDFTHLDYEARMALVAALPESGSDNPDERLIGVARYAMVPPSDKAEVGVVVEDAFQSQGLGKFLLKCLGEYALERGIHTFTGAIQTTNQQILDIIQSMGLPFTRKYVDGVWAVEIDLQAGNS
jgi:acetyltransferase